MYAYECNMVIIVLLQHLLYNYHPSSSLLSPSLKLFHLCHNESTTAFIMMLFDYLYRKCLYIDSYIEVKFPVHLLHQIEVTTTYQSIYINYTIADMTR